MTKEIVPNDSKIILYTSDDGQIRVDVRFQGETVWLTQKLMAELFRTTIPNINMHIGNIFKEGELKEDSVIKDFLITASDGKKYRTKYYSLAESELKQLNLIVSLYLDFAELQATNGRLMKMTDWIAKLDEFLKLSERKLLTNAGSISAEQAAQKAEEEFEKYSAKREVNRISDFDRLVEKSKRLEKK